MILASFMAACGMASMQSAEALYRLTPLPESGEMAVTLKVGSPRTSFIIPTWREGDYQLFQYYKTVREIGFFKQGRKVEFKFDGSGTWQIPTGADEVRYVVTPSGGNFSPNLRVDVHEAWVSGPVLGKFSGESDKSFRVEVAASDDYRLYVNKGAERSDGVLTFSQPTYAKLLDSPFLVSSKAKSATFKAGGCEHEFVVFGKSDSVSPQPFAEPTEKIVKEAHALFGGVPYDRYVFFGDVGGGYGGLENHASCRLGLWSPAPQSALSLISHEFFHTYNVKAIRPKSLTNPDFMTPAEVKSLWWLEGVTDYYAGVLLVRAGLWTQQNFLADLSRTMWSLERSTAAKTVSAEESSLRVWEGRGSQGFGGLSYYTKGKGIGLLLDLAIRKETDGKASLDNVMKTLYLESRSKGEGYDEARIKELVIEVGGEKLKPLFESLVEKPDPMPWDDLLKPFGLKREAQAIVLNREADQQSQERYKTWPFAVK